LLTTTSCQGRKHGVVALGIALAPKLGLRSRLAERPADAILAVAREEGSDVIALATHGRSGLTRLVVGSVADKVRRGAEMPVLLYRPQATDESTGRCRAAAVALPA
jgi:nucleotide-binding universal stress UspA family protein